MSTPVRYLLHRSDDALIHLVGDFVRHHRLNQNITQQELAKRAGINRGTLVDLEQGKRCNLLTLIQVLRVLNKLEVFQGFEVVKSISPMLLAEAEIKRRKRANKQGDGPTDEANTSW